MAVPQSEEDLLRATLGAVIKYHEDQLRVERDLLPGLVARLAERP